MIKQSSNTHIHKQYSLIEYGKGLIMLWKFLDHLGHDVVKNCNLVDIALKHLEGQEVPNLDVVTNGRSSLPLIHGNPTVHVLQLHHLGAAGVGLQDDVPRNGAKVRTKSVRN
jgi:hypothetical protein